MYGPCPEVKKCFVTEPIWYLKNVPIETVSNLDILFSTMALSMIIMSKQEYKSVHEASII